MVNSLIHHGSFNKIHKIKWKEPLASYEKNKKKQK
uniref:Uncharacterized protein n=1 Tax=Anguilla anguilla TaxID=7936 RepID=A0A0E9Q4U6_ANGAN